MTRESRVQGPRSLMGSGILTCMDEVTQAPDIEFCIDKTPMEGGNILSNPQR